MAWDPSQLIAQIPGITSAVPLATGGQKAVFRAQHKEFGDVAVKFLLDEAASDRFAREIEIAQTAKITAMPRLYEHGQIPSEGGSVHFVIEEFISGVSLRQRLVDSGPLSVREAMDLLNFLLQTAVEMEQQHLVHRDIKPENIIIRSQGGFCLLDFGIARQLDKQSLTRTDAFFGPHTPGYAAPEQFRNQKNELDIRADLFSIGIVVYETLTGSNPFTRGTNNPLEMLRRTETITPREVVIPGDTQKLLIGFLSVMMQRFPSRRPRDARKALDWFTALRPTVTI